MADRELPKASHRRPAGYRTNSAGRSVRHYISKAAHALADLMLPPVCLGCNDALSDHNALCGSCWRQVDFISAPLCDKTGLPLPYDTDGVMLSAQAMAHPPIYDRARATAHYTGVMRQLIHGFKYSDRHDARVLFGRWLSAAGQPLLPGTDFIVPVPLNRMRLLARRFNQSALLAKEVARSSDIRFEPMVLKRIRQTQSQVGKNAAQRRANVNGAFAVGKLWQKRIVGKNILLIDDVITTGATIEACARTLKRSGAARVDVLALAMSTNHSAVMP